VGDIFLLFFCFACGTKMHCYSSYTTHLNRVCDFWSMVWKVYTKPNVSFSVVTMFCACCWNSECFNRSKSFPAPGISYTSTMVGQFLGPVFVTGLRHTASQTKQIINYYIFLPFQIYKTVTEYTLIYYALGLKCISLLLITFPDPMTTKFYI
jgi:hypothetical protein